VESDKQTSLPISSNDNVKINNKSLVLPCVQSMTKSTDNCHTSDVENIEIEVNFIRRIII
jgi:hypothetical protein